ncbi:hypothetical protein [Nitrosomonas eutropha]|uniref:Uncharacterized protein n=1 Tax=Nitrosomonas eutropha TaxID=916 RepID=A0ABX5M381_9PROT|nr:hypothetical protein [Nitrosomonas eutropha]PXV73285.1 hypothetical protein C8R14_1584 [Nitrosomonas eutropha]SCX22362.1 hypothetical protein SAMN05216379_11848 [Nitrosomonas eutropha]
MLHFIQNKPTSSSLITQVRLTEYQLLHHQKMVDRISTRLLKNIQQQLIAPSNLWIAGGAGFILSELTKSKSPKISDTNVDKTKASKKTAFLPPWISTLVVNLISPFDILHAILNVDNSKK